MEVAIYIAGIFVGIVIWDMWDRAKARRLIEGKEKELQEAAKKLSDLHNSAMAANQDLQNKVQSLEAAYRAQQNPTIGVKRF